MDDLQTKELLYLLRIIALGITGFVMRDPKEFEKTQGEILETLGHIRAGRVQ